MARTRRPPHPSRHWGGVCVGGRRTNYAPERRSNQELACSSLVGLLSATTLGASLRIGSNSRDLRQRNKSCRLPVRSAIGLAAAKESSGTKPTTTHAQRGSAPVPDRHMLADKPHLADVTMGAGSAWDTTHASTCPTIVLKAGRKAFAQRCASSSVREGASEIAAVSSISSIPTSMKDRPL